MKNLLAYFKEQHFKGLGTPLSGESVVRFRKDLEENSLALLPKEYFSFLRVYNGLASAETMILGYLPSQPQYDLISFNCKNNTDPDILILGYDDLSVLIFDSAEKKYLLLDKESSDVVEEFETDELELALNSIVH
jgi:hypothetical protein